MINKIIFDLGNVLIHWNPDRVYAAYFKDKQKIQAFYTETKIFDLNLELDKGLPFDIGLKKLAAQYPHYHEPIHLWKLHWAEMIGGINEDTVNILLALHAAKYPLFALTNWSAETFPYVYYKYDFFKLFTDIVVSGRENLIKPQPEIYQLLLQRNALLAEECLFIDDNKANVHTANKLGIKSILFESAAQLLVDLKDLKLL